MKKHNDVYIIGIDHGYGNIKTANCCFPTGLIADDVEPVFNSDVLCWNNKYYSIGVGHKDFVADKHTDDDYYILTLAAIARELRRERIISTIKCELSNVGTVQVVKQETVEKNNDEAEDNILDFLDAF